jgi:hypothetical protein
MGYVRRRQNATKAHEVYEYLFRLDEHDERSLNDGFSWSILFMNDSSVLCRDILFKYGAELCDRTGDRIRFVFFSNLTAEELEEHAPAASALGGFLNYITQVIMPRRGHSKYDLERDEWNTLRPRPFHPLDTKQQIDRHISSQAQRFSPMPGSQEVHRLAQALGIGRFVPCFLLFSDIGELTVSLFPIERKSPEEVYDHLRIWIDSFYELNQQVIATWSTVEHSIKETVSRFNTSLIKVATWSQSKKAHWDTLQRFSEYLDAVANQQPNTDVLRKFQGDSSLPQGMRNAVSPFLKRLEEAEQRQKVVAEAAKWLNSVRAVSGPALLNAELHKLANTCGSKLPESISSWLSEAIRLCDPIEPPTSPQSELVNWWRSEFGRHPSRNRFEKHRMAWVNYSRQKYGSSVVGNVAKIISDEFAVVLHAALEQPVLKSAEESAQEVVYRLAGHLHVLPDDKVWLSDTSDYRQVLTSYFTKLRNHAPVWLSRVNADLAEELRWRVCVPLEEARKKGGVYNALNELPIFREVSERISNDWDFRLPRVKAEQQERISQTIARLFAAMDKWILEMSLLSADRTAIWSALVATLSSIRPELENRAFNNMLAVRRSSYPGDKFSEAEILELSRLLDEYDLVVKAVRLPFAADGEVLRVSLHTSLLEASGLKNQSSGDPARQIRKEYADTAERTMRSVRDWPLLKEEATSWSPGGKLWSVMNQVLTPDDINEALAALGAKNATEALEFLTNREKIICALDVMPVQSLTAVENALIGPKSRGDRRLATTKRELYDSIFLAVGLVPTQHGLITPAIADIAADKAQMLSHKVSEGRFDIFLAHNSEDRVLVSRLAQELRRHGIQPWVDIEQTPPGQWFQDVMQSAIRTVKSAAMIIGRSGVGRWQMLELRSFLTRCIEQQVPLIPVLLPGIIAIPDDFSFLRELHFVRFNNDITEPDALSDLIWGITGERPQRLF